MPSVAVAVVGGRQQFEAEGRRHSSVILHQMLLAVASGHSPLEQREIGIGVEVVVRTVGE